MGSKVSSYLAPNIIAQLGPLSIDCIEACGWFVKKALFYIINPMKMKAKVPNLSLLYHGPNIGPCFCLHGVSCFRNISLWRKLASNLALMNFQQI
jgi:hypothetical protein